MVRTELMIKARLKMMMGLEVNSWAGRVMMAVVKNKSEYARVFFSGAKKRP